MFVFPHPVSLGDPPPDRGLWTGRSVAQWIAGMLGRLVSPRRGTDYLGRLGFTRQVPRPRHAEADALAQEVFKARFRRRVQALQQENPDTPLEVWAMDEHRVGLKPVLRRVWAPRGCRPGARSSALRVDVSVGLRAAEQRTGRLVPERQHRCRHVQCHSGRLESPRVSRRLDWLSHAAMATSS
ncbi:winged helix-turn-helix domain-containing protein, partial [Azospirillum sp. YIM DDC1]